jgi:RHS repeat-associated protein
VFFYDRQNQLTRIEDSSAAAVASYAYDALGRRIEKIDHKANGGSGETLRFHYDGQRVIHEMAPPVPTSVCTSGATTSMSSCLRDMVGAGGTANAEYVFARDQLFSPAVAIATADGTITERYEYDVYGKPYILDADYTVDGSSDIGNPYLFTGRRLDTLDSGGFLIQYSRARYCDYETGRWYQREPLRYVDGMSLYQYVRSGPCLYVDFNGEWIHIVVGGAIGGAVGAITGGIHGGWKGALKGGVAGAVGGAVTAATLNPAIGGAAAAGLGTSGAVITGGAIAGGTGGLAGGIASEGIDAATGGDFDWGEVAESTATGTIGGAVTGSIVGIAAGVAGGTIDDAANALDDLTAGVMGGTESIVGNTIDIAVDENQCP